MRSVKANVVLIALVFVVLALATWSIQEQLTSHAQAQVGRSLQTVRDTTHFAVKSWFKDQKAAAVFWSQEPKIRALTQQLLLSSPDRFAWQASPVRQTLNRWFDGIQTVTRYRDYFIVGPGNINLASGRGSNIGVESPIVAQAGFLLSAWAGRAAVSLPVISGARQLDSHGRLTDSLPAIFVAAPIQADDGAVIAILMFSLDPEDGFTNTLRQGRIGSSGETYAFDGGGHLISQSRFDEQLREVGLIPAGERSILNLHLRDPGVNLIKGETTVPRNQQPLTHAVSSAISGESGVDLVGHRDYRGVRVVSAWLWDADMDFGISTELDIEEAYQSLRATELAIVLFILFIFLLVVGLAVVYRLYRLRKVAEQRVQKALNKARLYFDSVETVIVALDSQGNISRINRKGCELLGYAPDELVGRNWFATCLPTQVRDTVEEIFNTLMSGARQLVDYYENEVVTRNGDCLLLAWHNTFLYDEQGHVAGTLSAGEDITERKLSEAALRESESRFRLLVEGIGNNYLIYRELFDATFQYVSPAIRHFTGLPPGRALGQTWWELFNFTADTRDKIKAYAARLKQGELIPPYEASYIHPDSTERTVEIIEQPELDEAGSPVAILGIIKDITGRKKVEEALRRAATVFDNTDEGIVVTDEEVNIILVNKSFTTITGYRPEDVIGKNPRLQQSGRHDKQFYHEMWRSLTEVGQWRGEIWNRRQNGDIYPAWENINVVKDDQGRITNYVAIFSDISILKESEAKLVHLAHHDTLTALPNRLRFMANLEQALEGAKRHKHKVALMFLDLDRFKQINDTLGHDVGDRLLQTVAERLKHVVRAEDTVARLGGDEFTVVLTTIAHAEDAGLIAHKILEAIRQPICIGDATVDTSASVGISIFPDDANDCDGLMKAADTAMYHAKSRGRDSYQFVTADLVSLIDSNAQIEADLQQALENQEFELHYQPQVDVASGQIVGVEALIRWNHPARGQLLPETFIRVADDSGLIDDISEWVLQTALRDCEQWPTDGVNPLRISVNITGRQITSEKSIMRIVDLLKTLAPRPQVLQLDLEITETAADKTERTINIINRLKESGVMFAIDDFGTGHSSLLRLKQLPVDTLKIDRTFVRELVAQRDDRAIAAAIIAMAHSLGLRVVGEGVETRAQLDVLSAMKCDEIQGFYFSKPVPAAEVARLLSKTFR